jgi:hypothetical protein
MLENKNEASGQEFNYLATLHFWPSSEYAPVKQKVTEA